MRELSEAELKEVAGGMGQGANGGLVMGDGFATPGGGGSACANSIAGGLVAGAIAGISGGPWAIVGGAFGGAVGAAMGNCRP